MDSMWQAFEAICNTGGRLTGTASENEAVALLKQLGQRATGVEAQTESFAYDGWRCESCSLELLDGTPLTAHPLVRSASGSIEAEVIDLGRGEPASFEAHTDEIAGRIVLVRHELMFDPATIHRRLKYRAAVEAGAVGFLIAGPLEDTPVTGSSGRKMEEGIPAMGISGNAARQLARTAQGYQRVRMALRAHEAEAQAENLFFDVPGASDDWVVLCAHIDGHDLAESAIDNASGLAVALEVARRVCVTRSSHHCRSGLRLAFFNAEEWALTGSALHVAGLSKADRDAVQLVVNLDSVAGGKHLTALTSGFADLEQFLLNCAADTELGLYRPLQMNSDHANFAGAGIPAFRLVSGFGESAADTRFVLTNRDNREIVSNKDLSHAADVAEKIVVAALRATEEEAKKWRKM